MRSDVADGEYSAGICASVKTSKVPITVDAKADITCKWLAPSSVRGIFGYASER